jgi:hypothetical protein
MKDTETPAQIKQELVDHLAKLDIVITPSNVEWIEDGGYNG